MLVLDTDHLSLLEWGGIDAQRLRARLGQIAPEEPATTIISYEEQTRGWLAYVARARTLARQIDAYAQLKKHLVTYRTIRVLDLDEPAAIEYQRLRRLSIRIGASDLKIAAIVLIHDATLLSRNMADFRKVPGLNVEDWTL